MLDKFTVTKKRLMHLYELEALGSELNLCQDTMEFIKSQYTGCYNDDNESPWWSVEELELTGHVGSEGRLDVSRRFEEVDRTLFELMETNGDIVHIDSDIVFDYFFEG